MRWSLCSHVNDAPRPCLLGFQIPYDQQGFASGAWSVQKLSLKGSGVSAASFDAFVAVILNATFSALSAAGNSSKQRRLGAGKPGRRRLRPSCLSQPGKLPRNRRVEPAARNFSDVAEDTSHLARVGGAALCHVRRPAEAHAGGQRILSCSGRTSSGRDALSRRIPQIPELCGKHSSRPEHQ